MKSYCCDAEIIHTDICSSCGHRCDPQPEETAEDRADLRGDWMMECERNGD